jgi:hypothetical protein
VCALGAVTPRHWEGVGKILPGGVINFVPFTGGYWGD